MTLPIELSREQQIELLQDFIREQFISDGCVPMLPSTTRSATIPMPTFS